MDEGKDWRPRPFLAASAALHLGGIASMALVPEGTYGTALALLANQAVIVGACLSPGSRLVDRNLSRLPAPAATGRVVLSFDDGPDPRTTPQVLDLLDEHGARGSFFCIGERVDRHPALAREIAARGHRVENHTYSHPHSFAFSGLRPLRADIARAQACIADATGRHPRWFRAPAGIRSPLLDPILHSLGLRLVSWSRRGFDTLVRDPERILARLAPGVASGAILLIHDSSTLPGDPPPVLRVLPPLLARIREAGLRATALGDEVP